MEGNAATEFGALIVIVNSGIVSALLIGAGWYLSRTRLTEDVPDARQNAGEWVVGFFVRKAHDMAHGPDSARVVGIVAPILATFFLFIFASNLFGVLPIPLINRPPTAHFSVTLALALCSVLGTFALSVAFKGIGGAVKHLFWPNPMQLVSEVTDVMSLSLRLFGNIGGEYMTVVLVTHVVAIGIPLVLHVLGFIPAFVQALVFTLLTASFMSSAIHHEAARAHEPTQVETEQTEPTDENPALEGRS